MENEEKKEKEKTKEKEPGPENEKEQGMLRTAKPTCGLPFATRRPPAVSANAPQRRQGTQRTEEHARGSRRQ